MQPQFVTLKNSLSRVSEIPSLNCKAAIELVDEMVKAVKSFTDEMSGLLNQDSLNSDNLDKKVEAGILGPYVNHYFKTSLGAVRGLEQLLENPNANEGVFKKKIAENAKKVERHLEDIESFWGEGALGLRDTFRIADQILGGDPLGLMNTRPSMRYPERIDSRRTLSLEERKGFLYILLNLAEAVPHGGSLNIEFHARSRRLRILSDGELSLNRINEWERSSNRSHDALRGAALLAQGLLRESGASVEMELLKSGSQTLTEIFLKK